MASQAKIEELEGDDTARAAAESKSTTKRKRSRSTSGDTKFRGRLLEVIERIATSLEERGDEELAEILREDGPVMATGLTSLTGLLSPLRLPLLVTLAVIEPVLAFGRLFRVLAYRFADNRNRRAAERAMNEDRADGDFAEENATPPAAWAGNAQG